MLKLAKRPEWTHEVTISVPVDGGFENQTCRVRFRLIDDADLDPTDPNNPIPMLRSVVVRIDDLVDEAGQPLDWNDKVRDAVFAMPFVQVGLVKAYWRSVTGAREGNSAGPGARGQPVK